MRTRQALPSALALLVTLMLTADRGSAQIVADQQAKLLADDPAAFAHFGTTVAVSGNTAVVGAPAAVSGPSGTGVAYVFVREGASWTLQSHLQVEDAFDEFGCLAVAIDGDTAVVTGVTNFPYASAACVFVREGTSWHQQATLVGDSEMDGFGTSVAISGDTIAVGAPWHSERGLPTAGMVEVFVRLGVTWTLQARVTASDADAADHLGSAVALQRNTLLVGAPHDDNDAGINAGSGYVFVRHGSLWSEQAKVIDPDGAPNESFGFSVALDGRMALLSAPNGFVSGSFGAGTAAVFVRTRTTWKQQARLSAGDPGFLEAFGLSVAFSKGRAVVGAPGDTGGAGAAYIFVRGNNGAWVQAAKVVSEDASQGDSFGAAVALAGDTLIAGAPADDAGGSEAGAAYAFHLARR